MSTECSLCERDLRGGHDPECERSIPPTPCPRCGVSPDEEGFCQTCGRYVYRPAEDAAPALTQSEQRRLARAVGTLNRLLTEVRQRLPEAVYSLDGSGALCLMSGPDHDEHRTPRQDRPTGQRVASTTPGEVTGKAVKSNLDKCPCQCYP